MIIPTAISTLKTNLNASAMIILFSFTLALVTACGGAAPNQTESSADRNKGSATSVIESEAKEVIVVETVEVEKAVAVEKEVEAEKWVESSSAGGPVEPKVTRAQQDSPLKAGEVDDNAAWDDYLAYRLNYQGPIVHDRDVSERYIVKVEDGQGHPVLDAQVRFFLDDEEVYRAHTTANGQTLFQPRSLDIATDQGDEFLVVVKKEEAISKFSLPRLHSRQGNGVDFWTTTLDLNQQVDSVNLDLLFLVDATGSMDDEIRAIQTTIFDVAGRIDQLPERPNVRYGLVSYRDRGDEFVSRSYQFVDHVAGFSDNLSTLEAQGGGDYPESLNQGLHEALYNVEWRGQDTVRLIFLIADAPPHLDYAQDYDYAIEMETAARSAIKIYPIASSGLDDQGEYIFRQLAQFTQGRFIFLTYDGPSNGGQPGEVTTHHVDNYSVDHLDDLLVKLVTEELAYQNPLLARMQ